MEYVFSVAGIGIILDIPFEFSKGDDMIRFMNNMKCPIKEYIYFVPGEIEIKSREGKWDGFSKFEKNIVTRHLGRDYIPYAEMNWDTGVCKYDTSNPKLFSKSITLWNTIGLETLLIRHNRLLLHASFIRHNNRGILFSAPSGTGKSTQASLWEKHEDAEIINGDRAGLSCDDGVWTAWGLPYAGSSGIYKNESAPVEAIVILKQAQENRIQKVKPIQAFTYLLPEFNLHRWDEEFMDKALGLINRLIQDVPVYLLECRPDEEAVRVLKAELDGRR